MRRRADSHKGHTAQLGRALPLTTCSPLPPSFDVEMLKVSKVSKQQAKLQRRRKKEKEEKFVFLGDFSSELLRGSMLSSRPTELHVPEKAVARIMSKDKSEKAHPCHAEEKCTTFGLDPFKVVLYTDFAESIPYRCLDPLATRAQQGVKVFAAWQEIEIYCCFHFRVLHGKSLAPFEKLATAAVMRSATK